MTETEPDADSVRTAIVILNWNGRNYLERFLPALIHSVDLLNDSRSEDGSHDEIVIADNASTDGSLEMLKEKFPDIRRIVLDRNYGFTGGDNKALAQIHAQYYLLLNSDVEVTDGWLEPLEEWLDAHHLCGVCAPKLLSFNDREMFEYAGAAGGLPGQKRGVHRRRAASRNGHGSGGAGCADGRGLCAAKREGAARKCLTNLPFFSIIMLLSQ